MPPSRLAPCLLLPLLAVLSGCVSHPGQPDDSASAPPAGAVLPVGIDSLPSSVLGTPTLEVQTLSSWQPRIHFSWPRLPMATGLDRELTKTAHQAVDSFTDDYRDSTTADLSGSWTIVATSPAVRGVRLSTVEFGGASTGTSTQTLYGPTDSAEVWRGKDLLTEQGRRELPELAARAVREAGWEPTRLAGRGDLLDDVTFTREGGLTLVTDKGEIAPPDRGMVQVTISGHDVGPLLSDAGRTVRDAVAASTRAGDPTPSTEPSAATKPSPAASPGPETDCRKAKCIALTFDDGPGPLTSGILDILEQHHARATFFVLGPQVQANPAVMRRERELGMAIGNHSWTHADLARLGQAGATRELTRTSDAIQHASGDAPFAARPPYGSFTRATPHTGLPFVLWDVDTEDWKNRTSAVTTQRALAGAHPGAIILMHDIHPSTARALPGMVKALQGRGYTLVTVPELLGPMSAKRAYYSSTVSR